eukprot:TRINITY_DN12585_c0_g1_i1.p1 TRINITY_DN12585_c0_g1~~TRINITY_DN12585_c0_g1_i1.p1  ORF type:complete len:297 (-),score=44.84 TRINITY_DN12585_c0_g1_i1:225-1082(-)
MTTAAVQINKVHGVLLGLAAGDKNGGPIRMAIRLAESLVEQNKYDNQDVKRRYYNWYVGPPHDTERAFDTGATFSSVVRLVRQGKAWEEAARITQDSNKSAGINGAHRSIPLACFSGITTDFELCKLTQDEVAITHLHPASIQSAMIINLIIRHMIFGSSFEESLRIAIDTTKTQFEDGLVDELDIALKQADIVGCRLNSSGFAPHVVQAAIYHTRFGGQDFATALTKSLRFAGASNYSPVLTGALLGAKFGASAIPETCLEHIDFELMGRLEKVAKRIVATWNV